MQQEKPSARLTASPARVAAVPRRSPSDASKHSDSRLDHRLSTSTTQINSRPNSTTPTTTTTITTTGPRSSLAAGDAASRARIVRRVMAGGRSNLSKKKSSSKTSLTVGRHNLYNRAKSGSRSSLLGSRNNVFRASLDSQRTESTTDSGCNSPLSGSQCSLDGDRRQHGSLPSPEPRTTASELTSKTEPAQGRLSSSIHAHRPPEPPDAEGQPGGAMGGRYGATPLGGGKQGKSLLPAHSLSSSQLVREAEASKPVVSVKRSFSLQFPNVADAPQPSRPSLRPASSSSRLARPRHGSHEEGEPRPQPGISVSFRSLVPDAPQQCGGAGRGGARREVTKVSIVAEPKRREEKGVQVETLSSEEEYDEEEDVEEKEEEIEREGTQEEEDEDEEKEEEDEVKKVTEQALPLAASDDERRHSEAPPSRGTEEGPPKVRVHPPRGEEHQTESRQDSPSPGGGVGKVVEGEREDEGEEAHLMQRLETSLADIIDAAVLHNLRINGTILTDQFDAIIATLKKVAASVDSGETESPPLPRRDSQCDGPRGSLRTHSSSLGPKQAPASPLGPAAPRAHPTKTPLSLFSITECQAGHASTPPLRPRNRRLSLPKDSLQEAPPDFGLRFAHRDHEDAAHDLPSPQCYGRKNSTGSVGLWGRGAPQPRDGTLRPPSTAASVTNLHSSEDCRAPFTSTTPSFRKVHSTTSVSGAAPGGPPRLFQRHLSTPGPDEVPAEHRLRKSLSKSRELLTQLEHEYRRIKGDDQRGREQRAADHSWLEQDFDQLLETLSNGPLHSHDPRGPPPPAGDNNTALSSASSCKSDKWRTARMEAPPRPPPESPAPRRASGPPGADGRHIFSFFHKKGRSQSLSGTEAIKMALPVTPEVDPEAAATPLPTPSPSPRTARSNSIPSSAPLGVAAGGLPLDLATIFKRGRGAPRRGKGRPSPEIPQEEGGDEEEAEEDQESGKQTRSLSLPKSFLSDKYGLTGFKAALPR